MLFRILDYADYAHFLMNFPADSHFSPCVLFADAQVLSPEDFKQLRKLRLQKSIEQPSCKLLNR